MSKILKAVNIDNASAKAKTIEELKSLLAQEVASVTLQEVANTEVADTIAKKNDELATITAKATEVVTKNALLNHELAEAEQTITELSERLTLRENNPNAGVIVSFEGKDYSILGDNIITPNGKITAKQLSERPEEIKRLIEIESGILQLLTDVKHSNQD